MKTCASVSFGKDSLTLLLKLIEEKWPLDEVVFYDTGMEFQAIYDTRDKILPLLASKGIQYTELTPKNPFTHDMLERKVKNRSSPGYHQGYGWCGGLCRWGTSEKLRAILSHYGNDAIQYVGIAADETARFDKASHPNKRLPLVTWDMKEADCLQYCYDRGFEWWEDGGAGPVRLYDMLDRVSCWCCSNKNLKELKNIYLHQPVYWERLKGIQRHLDRPMKGYYRGQPRGVFELEERFKRELRELSR